MTKSALLVIDVQIDNVDPNGPYPFPANDVENMVGVINRLCDKWNEKDLPVIFVRQVFKSFLGKLVSRLLLGGITIEDSPGAQIDPRLHAYKGITIDKTKQDAFVSSGILNLLKELEITDLYITGLDGAYCVAETAKGALKKGFTTHLVTDAIITNQPDKAAKKLDKLIKAEISITKAENLI